MRGRHRIIAMIVDAPRFWFFEDWNLGFPKVISTRSAGWMGEINHLEEGIYYIFPVHLSCVLAVIETPGSGSEGLTWSLLLCRLFLIPACERGRRPQLVWGIPDGVCRMEIRKCISFDWYTEKFKLEQQWKNHTWWGVGSGWGNPWCCFCICKESFCSIICTLRIPNGYRQFRLWAQCVGVSDHVLLIGGRGGGREGETIRDTQTHTQQKMGKMWAPGVSLLIWGWQLKREEHFKCREWSKNSPPCQERAEGSAKVSLWAKESWGRGGGGRGDGLRESGERKPSTWNAPWCVGDV